MSNVTSPKEKIWSSWIGQVVYDWARGVDSRPVMLQRGGTRSGKTYNGCIAWVNYLLNEGAGERLSLVRRTGPALKATAWRDMQEVLRRHHIYRPDRHNKTEQEFTFPNGSVIEYFPVDDDEKVHGRARDHLWCNEANELPVDAYDQLIMRTKGKKLLDFNPKVSRNHWIYKRYEGNENAVWYRSTYKDNPFVTAEQIRIIEGYRHTDPWKYDVYALGKEGTPSHTIYTDVGHLSEWVHGAGVLGLDFGYNDPMALARVARVDKEGKPELHIWALLHESYLLTEDLAQKLPTLGATKHDTIVCDSAEPDRIETLCKHGFDAIPAKKGKGSVSAGIDKMKGHSIKIGGPAAEQFLHEFRHLRWQVNSATGEVLDVPVDGDDHGPDAVRYALHTEVMGTPSAFFAAK